MLFTETKNIWHCVKSSLTQEGIQEVHNHWPSKKRKCIDKETVKNLWSVSVHMSGARLRRWLPRHGAPFRQSWRNLSIRPDICDTPNGRRSQVLPIFQLRRASIERAFIEMGVPPSPILLWLCVHDYKRAKGFVETVGLCIWFSPLHYV